MQLKLQLSQEHTTEPYGVVQRLLADTPLDSNNVHAIVSMLMEDMEHLFGAQTNTSAYRFGGIYFRSTFPRLETRVKEKKFVIRLAKCSKDQNASKLWQLAHECVHMLSPLQARTSVLEEGIACWYQTRWTQKCRELFSADYWNPEVRLKGRMKNYFEAYSMVEKILSNDQDAVKKIRKIEPVIGRIKPTLLVKEIPTLDSSTAKKLCAGFYR